MRSPKYLNFINFLFNRDEALGVAWHFDLSVVDDEIALGISTEERVRYIGEMLTNYQTDLAHFSNWQLASGMEYIFNSSISDYGIDLCEVKSNVNEHIDAILALKIFFKECYNLRCEPILSHVTGSRNPLNNLCYMIGDVSILFCCEHNIDEINAAILEVPKYILTLDNIACIESALHWLGHLWGEQEIKEAKEITEKFIIEYEQRSDLNLKLLNYAYCAAEGDVL